jgi:hypothetical protein
MPARGTGLRVARRARPPLVEQWFDDAMDRASGWYKRRTQALLFVVGLLAAVVLNVDALHILHRMTADKSFRDVVVSHAAAARAPASAAAGGELDTLAQARGELDAVMLGAPFWFDVLNRIMIIRSTVKPHEKSPEEPSQDGGSAKVQRLVVSSADAPAPAPAPAPVPAGDAPDAAARAAD